MRSFATHSLVLLLTSAYALPAAPGNFTLSLTQIEGTGAYLKGTADASRARVAFLKGRALNPWTSVDLTPGVAGLWVLQKVSLGSPAVPYPLLFDTGSPITWFKYYVTSRTSVKTDQTIHTKYGSSDGSYFLGIQYKDRVTLAPNLVVEHQPVGSAVDTPGFNHFHGVLGLGPIEQTQGMLLPDEEALIPTVMDNLFAQGKINEQVFSVFLQPSAHGTAEGSVTFGGIDPRLYVGRLTYVSVTSQEPSSVHWGIEMACTFGDQAIIPAGTPGVLDSGTIRILLAKDYFEAYMNSIPGASYDWRTDLMVVSAKARSKMKPLHFDIGGTVFTLDVDAQLIPREQNVAWGGRKNRRYTWIGPMPTEKGEGLDFILGLPFMRKIYIVYETKDSRRRVGFANAAAQTSAG